MYLPRNISLKTQPLDETPTITIHKLHELSRKSSERTTFIDTCCATLYSISVIESVKHRGLKRFVEQDDSRRLPRDLVNRIKYILTQLNAAEHIGDMNLHSFNLHELKGSRKGTWSVTVRANWRMTFRFKEGHALDVDFEDYH